MQTNAERIAQPVNARRTRWKPARRWKRTLDGNAVLRRITLAALAAFFLFGGPAIGAMAILLAFACAMMCMGLPGLKGERIWLTMTLATYAMVAIMTWNGITECAPGSDNHCAVGR
jgi:uncharacterized RDD family membrane protein YckC